MRRTKKTACLVAIAIASASVFLLAGLAQSAIWNLPPIDPPELYGNLLLDRASTAHGEKPVVFSHWSHRTRYSCRVCHFELEFDMEKNATPMTEEDFRNGLYCGACHNNDTAFGHNGVYCSKCHTGQRKIEGDRFKRLTRAMPPASYGNGIDWVRAQKKLRPAYSIFNPEEGPIHFGKLLNLEAEWAMIPAAIFPHKPHVKLLDCSNCHPDIFNIKKKETKHFRMDFIIEKKFCGVCHLSVAFPLDDCVLCHPGYKG